MGRRYQDVVVFVTLYMLFSLPPFLVFNQATIDDVRNRLAPLDIVTVAVAGTGLFVLVAVLLLAEEGVDRYRQFLFAPTDLLSVIIELSFVLAAISWWLVPELVFRGAMAFSSESLLVTVLLCQLPMVVFLSLLTAIGKAG